MRTLPGRACPAATGETGDFTPPPFEPSLGFPEAAAAAMRRGTLPGKPCYVPAPPVRAPHPAQQPPGQGFPGDLPRPRPMGGPPPPIPKPIAPGSYGMRGPFSEPILPAPSAAAPGGAMQTNSGLRAEARGEQLPAGAPPAALPNPSKEKSAGSKRGKHAKAEAGQLAENMPHAMRAAEKRRRWKIQITTRRSNRWRKISDGGGATGQHQIR